MRWNLRYVIYLVTHVVTFIALEENAESPVRGPERGLKVADSLPEGDRLDATRSAWSERSVPQESKNDRVEPAVCDDRTIG